MIIFLYGPDTSRSRQKLNEIVEHYKKIRKNGLSLRYFKEEDFSLEDFKNELQTNSIFGEKKLIILKDIFARIKNEGKILDLIKKSKNSEDIILIYEGKEIKKNTPLFKVAQKYGKSQEFQPLAGEDLKNWIKKEFANFGREISSEALQKLIDFAGSDLWRQNNEIKKLVNFKPKGKIESKDVELLVRPKIETDIFKTIDAIALQNKKQALNLLYRHLEKGDSPLYLFSMINFQFRNILTIKDMIEKNKPYQMILKQAKLHPYIIKKSYLQAQKFTIQELKKIYQKIFQADLAIKTGKIDARIALDIFVAEI